MSSPCFCPFTKMPQRIDLSGSGTHTHTHTHTRTYTHTNTPHSFLCACVCVCVGERREIWELYQHDRRCRCRCCCCCCYCCCFKWLLTSWCVLPVNCGDSVRKHSSDIPLKSKSLGLNRTKLNRKKRVIFHFSFVQKNEVNQVQIFFLLSDMIGRFHFPKSIVKFTENLADNWTFWSRQSYETSHWIGPAVSSMECQELETDIYLIYSITRVVVLSIKYWLKHV